MTDPLLAKYEERIEREIVQLFRDGLLSAVSAETLLFQKKSLVLLMDACSFDDHDLDRVFAEFRENTRRDWIHALSHGDRLTALVSRDRKRTDSQPR